MTRFTLDIQMRFRDIDGMGHVNNATYLTYMELARTQFYLQPTSRTGLDELDFILAHADIDFESPAVWGDQLQVSMWPSKIGTTSFTLSYEIREVKTGRLIVRSKSVLVAYDYETKQVKPIPPEVRTRLGEHLEE